MGSIAVPVYLRSSRPLAPALFPLPVWMWTQVSGGIADVGSLRPHDVEPRHRRAKETGAGGRHGVAVAQAQEPRIRSRSRSADAAFEPEGAASDSKPATGNGADYTDDGNASPLCNTQGD
ncbi:hypothetical protein PVAP13_6KG093418 [Panicum virgatum]|uniref:Uncharacterized protein n=1 Tax=Panicum virgatum TaxID=38727 RepID=A0A8T0RCF2_PANVG|nr:hypothetical protein PVAP13_6KG093418 [Panicum virgatum]